MEEHLRLVHKTVDMRTQKAETNVWLYCDKKWTKEKVLIFKSGYLQKRRRKSNFHEVVFVNYKPEESITVIDGMKSVNDSYCQSTNS